ncbi:MAG: hypothetical protein V3R29_08100 [Candidatus Acidoferrales bacterium]
MSSEKKTQTSALLLAVLCSLLTGTAQLLFKWGADRLRSYGWADSPALLSFLLAYFLLAIALVVLLQALRRGEMSTLYPVLAARYVWVVTLTPFLFSTESLNLLKIAGAGLAAVGVAIVAARGR